MQKEFWKRAVWETFKAVFAVTVFSLAALALAAVFVRAYAPPQAAVTAVNWVVKCTGVFLFSLIFIGRERAVFKGMAAGVLSSFVTLAVFAAIGGAKPDGFFALELFVTAVLGACGALLGAKLRKR